MFYVLRYNDETLKYEVLCTCSKVEDVKFIIDNITTADLAMCREHDLQRLITTPALRSSLLRRPKLPKEQARAEARAEMRKYLASRKK